MRNHAIFAFVVVASTCATDGAIAHGGGHHGGGHPGGSSHGGTAHTGLAQAGTGLSGANRGTGGVSGPGQPAAGAAGIAPGSTAGSSVGSGPQNGAGGSAGDAGGRSRGRANNTSAYGDGVAGGGYGGYAGGGGYAGYGGYGGGYGGPADFGAAVPPFPPAAAGVCPPGDGARSLDLAREDKAPVYKTNGHTYGQTCTTLLRSCPLPSAFYLGESCSCSVPGGRSGGHITQ